jgi:hypothetical protein
MSGPLVTLALLPLENLSGFESDTHLATGFLHDLIAELSRFPALGVIAADSVSAALRECATAPGLIERLLCVTCSREAFDAGESGCGSTCSWSRRGVDDTSGQGAGKAQIYQRQMTRLLPVWQTHWPRVEHPLGVLRQAGFSVTESQHGRTGPAQPAPHHPPRSQRIRPTQSPPTTEAIPNRPIDPGIAPRSEPPKPRST